MTDRTPLNASFLGKTMQETQEYYDKWAQKYDDDVVTHGYNAPKYLMELMPKYVKPDDLVLAVGAGTGTEAVLMKERGFKRIHVHDGSEEMLNLARKKGHFEDYFFELLMPGQQSQFKSAHYDAMVCIGCFLPGALDERHVDDLIRTIKPGGISIIATRQLFISNPGDPFDYPFELEKKLQQVEKDGHWTLLERRQFDNYSEGGPGVFFIHRKK